jgi:signal transduction histidine kinase/ActR/RegA family two-component response regulator
LEEELSKRQVELELRVQERTAELTQAYDKLMEETKERAKLEEQRRQSQKMEAIGTLAGGIAHDFNNILAAIIGFTEMVEEDLPPESQSRPRIGRVLKAASRGKDLVRQILAFSRKTELERKPLSLSSVIHETFQLLRASLPTTIEMNLGAKATRDTILATPAEVQQIIMNLATNAFFAMREKGGVLSISTTDIDFEPDSPVLDADVEPGEYVQLVIADTGHGMEHHVMQRVFEPFFTTKGVGEGTGMGLAVVYGIVKSLHGTIAVESEPGKGSTFRICLPVARADENQESVVVKTTPRGTEHILIIDDEELLVEWGQAALERLGYSVTALTDSMEALKLFSVDPSRFDLVITDQTMPNLTGLHLARKLMAIRTNIPIILCTGHSDSVSPEKAKDAGIKDFLMKPLGKQQLAEAIRKVLNTARSEG